MLLHAIALSFVLTQTQEPNLAAKVDFVCNGLNTPKLVEQLGQAAHVPLFAPKAFESDILAIRLKGAPLKEAMDKIASLTAGEWVRKDAGYELIRSREKLRADELAEQAAEIAFFAKSIDEQKRRAARLEAFDEARARTLAQTLVATHKDVGDQYDNRVRSEEH